MSESTPIMSPDLLRPECLPLSAEDVFAIQGVPPPAVVTDEMVAEEAQRLKTGGCCSGNPVNE